MKFEYNFGTTFMLRVVNYIKKNQKNQTHTAM